MFRKATAVLTALLVTLSFTSCQKEKKSKKCYETARKISKRILEKTILR